MHLRVVIYYMVTYAHTYVLQIWYPNMMIVQVQTVIHCILQIWYPKMMIVQVQSVIRIPQKLMVHNSDPFFVCLFTFYLVTDVKYNVKKQYARCSK